MDSTPIFSVLNIVVGECLKSQYPDTNCTKQEPYFRPPLLPYPAIPSLLKTQLLSNRSLLSAGKSTHSSYQRIHLVTHFQASL